MKEKQIRSRQGHIYFTEEEADIVALAAEKEDLPFSLWARKLLVKEANKVLGKSKRDK